MSTKLVEDDDDDDLCPCDFCEICREDYEEYSSDCECEQCAEARWIADKVLSWEPEMTSEEALQQDALHNEHSRRTAS